MLLSPLADLNNKKEIRIRPDCSTSCDGLVAAGDVTNAFGKQIAITAGEGAKAVLVVKKHLMETRDISRVAATK